MKKISDKYYINTPSRGFVEIKAEEIKIKKYPWLDLFIHIDSSETVLRTVLSEGRTGMRIYSLCEDELDINHISLIEGSIAILDAQGEENIKDAIRSQIKDKGLSPRYEDK